jgi:hypothetical protein
LKNGIDWVIGSGSSKEGRGHHRVGAGARTGGDAGCRRRDLYPQCAATIIGEEANSKRAEFELQVASLVRA